MKSFFEIGVVLLVVAGVLAYLYQRANYKPKTRHPTIRSRSTVGSYQQTNSAAKLLADAVALKEIDAKWPRVIQTLNAEDEPRLRTVLLELRRFDVDSPQAALKAIEDVCLASHHESGTLSRFDLLDRAKSVLERANT